MTEYTHHCGGCDIHIDVYETSPFTVEIYGKRNETQTIKTVGKRGEA